MDELVFSCNTEALELEVFGGGSKNIYLLFLSPEPPTHPLNALLMAGI